MKRFAQASAEQFEDLERHAREACVRFFDVELPQGANPNRGMIGFEVDQATGAASLLVERGVHYAGDSQELAEWFRHGEKVCRNFGELQEWILGNVCSAIRANGSTASPPTILPVTELTDLSAVMAGRNTPKQLTYVTPDEIVSQLSETVRGQAAAITELSRRVSRHLARTDAARPLTVMAIGPTGTGKTKTAETLASVLRELESSENRYNYLRIDCSELTESHRVSQLLGAPPGYVGHGQGAQLIDQLAADGRTLVLFDEIEKAHADVLKVLLNAIDCGRLTGSSGRAIDARRAIFYFTTNLESEGILSEVALRNGFDRSECVQHVCRSRLHAAGLKPELIGRITTFLLFQHLTPDVRAEVAALTIARVGREYGLQVERIEPETIVSILALEKTRDFGARPIEFLIDNELGDEFAKAAQAGITGATCVHGSGPYIVQPLPLPQPNEQ